MENIDHRISHTIADFTQRSAFLRRVADVCASQLLCFFFGIFVYHLVLIGQNGLPAWMFFIPVVVSWLMTFALEYLIGRKRPFQELGKKLSVGMLWIPPSFPSAHATIAFSIAYILWSFGISAVVVYSIAVAISLGRVAVRVHYVTDILAGAFVGTTVTYLMIHSLL